MSTNTNMATPTCENCGRDKTATYICDGCCDKLNDAARKRASDYAALEAERDEWRQRAQDAEHRIEHPPLAENQDDLARICYEAYMQYTSPDSLEDKSWADLCAWESYGWRLAANAVRVATEAERDELKRRIDAIKSHVGFAAEVACCCEYNSCEDRIVHCEWCVDAGNIIAIAEGRDNG